MTSEPVMEFIWDPAFQLLFKVLSRGQELREGFVIPGQVLQVELDFTSGAKGLI